MNKTLFITAILLLAPVCLAEPSPDVSRVLFVGNSYFYYNDSLHNHVKRIVEELRPDLAKKLQFKSATIGGARLHHHNLDWLLDHERIGVKKSFELVIMQGHSTATLSRKTRNRFYKTVQQYASKVRAAGARPMLYMTPAYVPPHKKARDGMISDIAAGYIEAGRLSGARVIPVGLAFELSYLRKPDLPLHELFDGTHPNTHGTYLAACVVYLSVYGGSLAGLEYDYFGELSAADITWLQAIATETMRQLTAGKPAK